MRIEASKELQDWREGASATIAGGTSEIQRSIVARDVFADRGGE